MKIYTKNYFLEPLQLENVTTNYLDWLQDLTTSKFIQSSKDISSLNDLQIIVSKWIDNPNIIFLGIFDKHNKRHIGNIKFDPVNTEKQYSVLGILIGEKTYQGKNVAKEVILACAEWLQENRQVKTLILGVNVSNERAIKAYEKIGFKAFNSEEFPETENTYFMSYNI